MNDFKIGDKIKVKKLSIEEFEKVYHIKYKGNIYYNNYLDTIKRYLNKIFKINRIISNRCEIYCENLDNYYFFEEEVEKISYIKTKFKIVNKLLNNKGSKYE